MSPQRQVARSVVITQATVNGIINPSRDEDQEDGNIIIDASREGAFMTGVKLGTPLVSMSTTN